MRRLADAGLTTREACGNSVRNITACPYAGVVGRRGLRRHAVCRGADALLPAPPAQRVAAAEVQDRLRGLPEDHALTAINDIGWRAPRVESTAAARVPRDRRRRHGDHVHVRRRCCTSSCPWPRCSTSAEAIVRVFHRLGRLQAQAAQPDEVPDQVARLGRASGPSSRRRSPPSAPKAARRCRSIPSAPPVEAAPDWAGPAPPSARSRSTRACSRRRSRGPGIRPGRAIPSLPSTDGVRRVAAHQRPRRRSRPGYVAGDRHGAARRSHRRSRCASSRSWRSAYGDGTVRVTADQDLRLALGARRAMSPALYARLAAAGLRPGRRGHGRRRHELPGRRVVQARGDAVARARPSCSASTCARGPELVGAARRRCDIKISGCPNGCGQHHIAGHRLPGQHPQARRHAPCRSTS